jgi:hypothetical protein
MDVKSVEVRLDKLEKSFRLERKIRLKIQAENSSLKFQISRLTDMLQESECRIQALGNHVMSQVCNPKVNILKTAFTY